ncbi:hypothetical protein FHW58_003858 [Duganella sp. 1224]|uniref:DUF3037 domain-containing protein n=1 Tax=Duganella sp. 1224 TaxID=2587052 RepID=UPI0015C8255D|nr:DUF3037 domain-containing protein [Duganella sp. 1224]NYE62639.1 hypothetical protein [Duganella sp. 1224]
MMNIACHYAIARFAPFVETGEFANVGVVMFAPGARFFGFKLLGNRYARVTNFFEGLDTKVFKGSITGLREELDRILRMLQEPGTLSKESQVAVWTDLVKPRETMVRFSEPRIVMADDCEAKLLALYDYYVGHNFATKEYHEKLLERAVTGWLRDAGLQNKFHPARIGNDEYHAHFPFVSGPDTHPERIIKPLNLNHADAAKIIDHGGLWLTRIAALKKRDLLPPQVLFTVQGPAPDESSPRGRAKNEIVTELKSKDVLVIPHGSALPIIEFAKSGTIPSYEST